MLDGAVSVNLDESLGLVATQTFTFLSAGIDGSAAMSRRLGDAHAGVLAGRQLLIGAGLAAPGGAEIVSPGVDVLAVFAAPRACADVVTQVQRAPVAQAWPGTRLC